MKNTSSTKIIAAVVVMMMVSVGCVSAIISQDTSAGTPDSTVDVNVAPGNRWVFTPAFPSALTDVTTTESHTDTTGITVSVNGDTELFHKNTNDGKTVATGGKWIFAETYTVQFSSHVAANTTFVLSITGTSNLGGTQSYTVQYNFHIKQGVTVSGTQSNIVKGNSINFTPTGSTDIGTLSWDVSGSLPAGLSKGTDFNTTGKISGTPTTVGENTIKLSATAKVDGVILDSKVLTVKFTVYNTIVGGSDETITTYPGHSVSSTAINQTGTDLNVVWSQAATDTKTLQSLGFTLNATSGVITGTNSSGGTYTVHLVGTSSTSGQTANKTITIVTEKALTLSDSSNIYGREDIAYTRELSVNNALNGYTFKDVSATNGVTASISNHTLTVSSSDPVPSFTVTFKAVSTTTGQTVTFTLSGQMYPTTVITNPTVYVFIHEV